MKEREASSRVDRVLEAPQLAQEHLETILRSLVAAQSVNPGTSEAEAAAEVQRWLDGFCESEVVEFMPGRPSVGALLSGRRPGTRLVFNGHLDTVPVDDPELWESDPFTASVRDGYMYGRGACDMKAGLAAQIAVAQFLAARRDDLAGSLVLHFAAGEECAEPGTLSLLRAGFGGDVGIVTEPTGLKVATSERGLVFFRIKIKGRSGHASRPELAVNPLPRLQAVLDVVRQYDVDIRAHDHPLLPPATCTPTMVTGGVKENSIPDTCELTVDRRLLPGQKAEDAMSDLKARLENLRSHDPDFAFEIAMLPQSFAAAETDPGSEFVQTVLRAVERVTGSPAVVTGTAYSSDVRNLINDAGMEAVTFGAGEIGECHCANERVSLAQVTAAARTLALVASEILLPG